MVSIYDIRKSNALKLIGSCGGVLEFARRIDRPGSLISAIVGVNATKNIGDKLARHIENSFELKEYSIECSYFIVPGKSETGIDFEHLHTILVAIATAAAEGILSADQYQHLKSMHQNFTCQ